MPHHIQPKGQHGDAMNYEKRFVTAKLKGEEDCRQGVCVTQSADTLTVLGESGTVYECEPDAVVVPMESLWGSTREFAISQGVSE